MIFNQENNKNDWNKFVIEQNGLFLQSFEWGEFQESLGRKVWRINIDDGIIGAVYQHNLPFKKSFLYCPRGPVFVSHQMLVADCKELFQKFLDKIKEIAERENAIFFRIEPEIQIGKNLLQFTDYDLRKLSFDVQPSRTLILDLGKSEDELLAEMHSKTRYNIRLAEKKEVAVQNLQSNLKLQNFFDKFYDLLKETAQRNRYKIFSKEHYQKLLGISNEQFSAEIFFAKYKDSILAANMVIFFGNRAIYLHGGSSNRHRNLMAPHLLQWEQIKEAKRRGFKEYDFWGIDKKKWPGVTRFKKGFGGKELEYIGAHDLIFRPLWYFIYRVAKSIR